MKQLDLFNVATLDDAKEHIKQNIAEGCICPACNQHVKLYKRKLNSSMAITLIRLWRHRGARPTHVKNLLKSFRYTNSHDWTLLRHWGLLTQCDDAEFNTSSHKVSGYWRMTSSGISFIHNNLKVKEHILIYNNKFIDFEGGNIDILDALQNKFDYQELMMGDVSKYKND